MRKFALAAALVLVGGTAYGQATREERQQREGQGQQQQQDNIRQLSGRIFRVNPNDMHLTVISGQFGVGAGGEREREGEAKPLQVNCTAQTKIWQGRRNEGEMTISQLHQLSQQQASLQADIYYNESSAKREGENRSLTATEIVVKRAAQQEGEAQQQPNARR